VLSDLTGEPPAVVPEPGPEPETFDELSLADARAHISQGWNRLAVSTEQKYALIDYSSTDGYSRINTTLRESGKIPAGVKALDQLVEKAVTPQNLKVFRGFGWSAPEGVVPGAIIEDLAYVSTSLRREVGEKFATSMLFEIELPAGSRALPMTASLYPEEVEMLLPRGTRFRVDSVSDGYPKIAKVRALPPRER